MAPIFDVVGIGNAIVDVVATVHEDALRKHGLVKGSMTLVGESDSAKLYESLGPAVERSGGSAANTVAGIAALGGKCAYIGRVGADALGDIFRHDFASLGVEVHVAREAGGQGTARCLVMVSPDAQRTMATYLGDAGHLGPDDVPEAVIKGAAWTYLEGYLFDRSAAKDAFRRAQMLARNHGRRVALTLSDAFCVRRHKADFLQLIRSGVDVLFANEVEVQELLGTADGAQVQRALEPMDMVAVVTRSERGSTVVTRNAVIDVPAETFGPLLDTTGAGDLYASGFLFGLANGAPLRECATLGSVCAGEVITHLGARPESSLRAVVASRGLASRLSPDR
jgi:sugar/nucleoside kinase (ribokinase family)